MFKVMDRMNDKLDLMIGGHGKEAAEACTVDRGVRGPIQVSERDCIYLRVAGMCT
jgi:hypothetical protein